MNRYAPTYRQPEITLVCRQALRGESLCFVGVAGTGKTNLTNLLCQDPYSYKPRYLREQTARVHFVLVDVPVWDGTATGLWRLMLNELRLATAALGSPPRRDPQAGDALAQLRSRIAWICQELDEHVVFLLDDADKLLEMGPLPTIEQLYDLRNRGNKNRLSYALFTKRLPHLLGSTYGLGRVSKFYDLFSDHIYALGLYEPRDAGQMARFLNHESGDPLSDQDLIRILKLSGNHAALLRAIFEGWMTAPQADRAELGVALHQDPDIERLCDRILLQLHRHEQEVAIRAARHETTPADSDVLRLLVRRGLLVDAGTPRWFSPLFLEHLRRQTPARFSAASQTRSA